MRGPTLPFALKKTYDPVFVNRRGKWNPFLFLSLSLSCSFLPFSFCFFFLPYPPNTLFLFAPHPIFSFLFFSLSFSLFLHFLFSYIFSFIFSLFYPHPPTCPNGEASSPPSYSPPHMPHVIITFFFLNFLEFSFPIISSFDT